MSVQDPWETAEFYKEALGLEEVTELDGALAEGVFLTDGVVNPALLKFKTDAASQGTGKDFVGIHHIGFWVDDVVEQGKIVRNTGATWIMGDPNNPDGYEVKHTDLSGIIFDIAAHGWAGSRKILGNRTTSCTGIRSGDSPNSMSAAQQLARTSRRAWRSRRRLPSDRPTRPDGGPVSGRPLTNGDARHEGRHA